MSWEYCCPECKGMLNPGCDIIMTAKNEDIRVMIGMHPQPGKYEVYLPPNVECENGSKWEFSCPLCQHSLVHEKDKNLCELELRIEGKPMLVLFSRIAGEHATFILHEETLKERYGKDATRYDPFLEHRQFNRLCTRGRGQACKG